MFSFASHISFIRSVTSQECQTRDVHTDNVEVQSYETDDQEVIEICYQICDKSPTSLP